MLSSGEIAAIALVPVGIVGVLYVIRKIRVHQWGWVTNKYSLKDKTYLITGANTGLGYFTARALAMRGATVVLLCRSKQRATEAIERIKKDTSKGHLVFLPLDLTSLDSVRECAALIKKDFPNFNCLINNAGLSVPDEQLTQENYELHFGVNHLGHFLLFKLLEDNIRQNKSRIVNVASLLHQDGVIKFDLLGKYDETMISSRMNRHYNNTKLMNFYFTRELYKRGFDAHTLCPGLCYTDFFRNITIKWYQIIGFSPVLYWIMRSAEQGAQNIIYAATDNQNTEEKNPANGYYIVNLKLTKSTHQFDDDIGVKLWNESLKMCGLK